VITVHVRQSQFHWVWMYFGAAFFNRAPHKRFVQPRIAEATRPARSAKPREALCPLCRRPRAAISQPREVNGCDAVGSFQIPMNPIVGVSTR
jgi:hypothetical protein